MTPRALLEVNENPTRPERAPLMHRIRPCSSGLFHALTALFVAKTKGF